jgi:chemotaxis signal transduction protein
MPLSPSHLAPRQRSTPTLHGRYLLFAVHGRTYAVEASRVKQVRRGEGAVDGELVFLGVPYTVIDLRALLGFPDWDGAVEGPHGRVAVLVAGVGLSGALLVDSIVNLVLLPLDVIGSLPLDFSAPERRWLRGMARVDGKEIPVLDVDALLPYRLERRYAQGLAR